MSVTLVLCLMMVLRILILKFSIFLSMAPWLVSGFFANASVRDHGWHLYVIAGKTTLVEDLFLD